MKQINWEQIMNLSLTGLILIAILCAYKLFTKSPNPSPEIQNILIIVISILGISLLISIFKVDPNKNLVSDK